jgi:hypothetical protein
LFSSFWINLMCDFVSFIAVDFKGFNNKGKQTFLANHKLLKAFQNFCHHFRGFSLQENICYLVSVV